MSMKMGTLAYWLCLGITFAVALTALIVALVHSGSNGHDTDKHSFCFAEQRILDDGEEAVIGHIKVKEEHRLVCWDLLYQSNASCNVDSIRLMGPVNEMEGIFPAQILVNISDGESNSLGVLNRTTSTTACAHVTSSQLRALLSDPSKHYIEMTTVDPPILVKRQVMSECGNTLRAYISGLCHHSDYDEHHHDDDDDDTGHHHSHSHGHDDDDDSVILAQHVAGKGRARNRNRFQSHRGGKN